MNTITYNYFDNLHPSTAEGSIKRSLAQYISRCDYVYVGRTNNPEQRFNAHQRNLDPGIKKWDEMLVVYGTKSLGYSVQMENELIEFIQRGHYDNVRWNTKGTQWNGPQEYAIYLLVDGHGERKPLPNNIPTLSDDQVSGHYNPGLEAVLQKQTEMYVKNQKRFYIGLTNDPWRRFGEHQREWTIPWDDMVVIYRTSSLDYAARAEAMLIEHFRNHPQNKNNAGGMVSTDVNPYFYVYFLLDRA